MDLKLENQSKCYIYGCRVYLSTTSNDVVRSESFFLIFVQQARRPCCLVLDVHGHRRVEVSAAKRPERTPEGSAQQEEDEEICTHRVLEKV